MNLMDKELFTALAREAERQVRKFNAQELANSVWGFAAAHLLDVKLFAALAREAERHVS